MEYKRGKTKARWNNYEWWDTGTLCHKHGKNTGTVKYKEGGM